MSAYCYCATTVSSKAAVWMETNKRENQRGKNLNVSKWDFFSNKMPHKLCTKFVSEVIEDKAKREWGLGEHTDITSAVNR